MNASEEGRARKAAKTQWSKNPAGTTLVTAEKGSADFFKAMTDTRYAVQPWHPELLRKFAPDGVLLEIGCGAGTDHAELAKYAALTVGIDLAHEGASLTRKRLLLEGRPGLTLVADAEHMPFRSGTFDHVYSFGVVHHTDHPERVADEMFRVMKPGGSILVAVYHKLSLVTLWLLMRYLSQRAFLRERWSTYLGLVEAGADQLEERPLVRLYTRRAARSLFARFNAVSTEVVHSGFNAGFLEPAISARFGWYVVVHGTRD
ncbi:MAG: class I SAM-dependent methyltransferase [Actinobacteria bacterium]|nr:class I SAM-dependent methyltransferase [Actinomycetota bacterium]